VNRCQSEFKRSRDYFDCFVSSRIRCTETLLDCLVGISSIDHGIMEAILFQREQNPANLRASEIVLGHIKKFDWSSPHSFFYKGKCFQFVWIPHTGLYLNFSYELSALVLAVEYKRHWSDWRKLAYELILSGHLFHFIHLSNKGIISLQRTIKLYGWLIGGSTLESNGVSFWDSIHAELYCLEFQLGGERKHKVFRPNFSFVGSFAVGEFDQFRRCLS
jgi:hypothetical protein